MIRKAFLKSVAVLLSASILSASLVFSAAQETYISENATVSQRKDGYETVDLKDFTDNQENFSSNIPYPEQLYSEGEKCGVSLNFGGGFCERAIFTSCKYNIDGFYFKIDRIEKKESDSKAPKFCILASPEQNEGQFIILFDTQNGTVSYFNYKTSKTQLLVSEKLKYVNIASGFTVGFSVTQAGILTLYLEFADETELSAGIPTAYSADVSKNADSSYIGISPYESDSSFSVDISGIKCDRFTRPTSVTFKATVADGKNELINGNLDCFPSGMISVFNGTDIVSRHISQKKYEIDGLRIRFDELKKADGYESHKLQLAITLTDNIDNIGNLRIQLDTDNGALGYYSADTNVQALICDDELKYENISDKEFIIGFDKKADGGCSVFISVDTSPRLYGEIPADFFALLGGIEEAYFTLSPANSVNYFSVKTTGIYNEEKTDGFYIPYKWDFRDIGGYTENLPQKSNVHNGWDFKGTRLTFSGGDVGKRFTSEKKYNFDGISLRFDNLTKIQGASGALRFTVLASERYDALGGFRVMFDTEAGTLSYFNAETAPTVFLTDDALKYENLSAESFILSLNSHKDGSLKCSVKIGGELIYGYIPAAFCNNLPKNKESAYLMIAPGKAIDNAQYYFSLDITGIKCEEYTVPSGSVLRKIVSAGNSVSNKKNGGFPLGETSNFYDAVTSSRQCSRNKYKVDGLKLRFDGLAKTDESAQYPVMALRLTEDINANSGTTLYIDTQNGAIALDSLENILITSEVLEYKRISNREFTFSFSVSNGECTAEVTVAGYEPISFVLPSALPSEELYFAVAPCYDKAYSFSVTLSGVLEEDNYINNSWLLPAYKCDGLVSTDSNGTPEWLSSAIIAEVNVSVFGTFYDMIPILDYCAETGINTLWIPPVSDKGVNGNGYSNMGLDTIDPYLTGILDYGEEWRQLTDEEYSKGWEIYAEFIEEAHKRNIRILFDVVSFGVLKESPLIAEHPAWFKGYSQESTCNDFNWNNSELVEWHINNLADIALKTGVDGFRFDSEPMITGYEVNRRLRNTLLSKGRKLIYIAEARNNDNTVYDLSEGDIQGPDYISVRHFESVFLKNNIVDSVLGGQWIGAPEEQDIHQSGTFKYYTFQLCCHDSYNYGAQGNRLVMGYETLYSPFVPLWVLGEEMNNGKDGDWTRILYLNTLKRADLREPEKRAFYEDVKKMIEIRRKNADIFELFSENHREANICKVDTVGGCELQAYARFAENKGAVIVPNNTDGELTVTVKPRFYEMGISGYPTYTVKDLKSDIVIAEGTEEEIAEFTFNVSAEDTGIVLITANGIKGENKAEPVPEEPEDNSDMLAYIPYAPDCFAPDADDFVDFSSFWDTNVPEIENVLVNGMHKGVRLTFNGGDVGRRITASGKYNVDGLTLKFDGLIKNEASVGNPNITVMLSASTELDKFRVMINTNDGTLSYYNGTVSPVVIASSELLKLNNLSENSFTVAFNICSDGSVRCTVGIGENGTVSGIIPKTFADQIANFGSSPLYVAVGPGKADPTLQYHFSLNIVSIYHNQSTNPQSSVFSNISNSSLTSVQDIKYGNSQKGVKLKFDGCNIGGCQMYKKAYSLDGLRLYFDGLCKNDGYEENLLKFSVCIGDSPSSLPRFRLVFDTMRGTISYYSGENPYGELVTVAQHNILKYKNLKDKPFDIVFRVTSDLGVAVIFSLGDKSVTGKIPAGFYGRYISSQEIYFGISTSNKNGYFSLVLDGIEQTNTLSFDKDWYKRENVFVADEKECRLPFPEAKAGHWFFGWLGSDGKLYEAGQTVAPTENKVFSASVAYPGDVNLNGEKEADDLIELQKCLLSVRDKVSTADANCDAKINILDFIRLKKIIAD